MFFSQKEKMDHHLCVIDIGSGTVAGAFVDISKNEQPQIRFTYRSNIKEARSGTPYKRYYLSMVASLEETLRKLSQNTKELPEEIVVYLRAPWVDSSLRSIKKESKKEFTFNQNDFKKLIGDDNILFAKELSESSMSEEGFTIVDQRVESLKINGYEVEKMPKSVKAKKIEIKTFTTVAPSDFVQEIENVIFSEFDIDLNFSSFSRSICNLSKQFMPDVKDYLLFDVGALVTEISVVKNCQAIETMTLPQGFSHINEKLYANNVVSNGLVDAYVNEHTTSIVNSQIKNLVNSAKEKWLDLVSKTLNRFSGELSLPSTIVLMTEDSNPAFFAKALKDESFTQYFATDKKFNVIIISTSAFENVCKLDKCKPDALLMAEVINIKNKYYA
jgi:hypothetical protein